MYILGSQGCVSWGHTHTHTHTHTKTHTHTGGHAYKTAGSGFLGSILQGTHTHTRIRQALLCRTHRGPHKRTRTAGLRAGSRGACVEGLSEFVVGWIRDGWFEGVDDVFCTYEENSHITTRYYKKTSFL